MRGLGPFFYFSMACGSLGKVSLSPHLSEEIA